VGVAFQWNSLLICISNKPTTTTEEFDAFQGFMLIKIYKMLSYRRETALQGTLVLAESGRLMELRDNILLIL